MRAVDDAHDGYTELDSVFPLRLDFKRKTYVKVLAVTLSMTVHGGLLDFSQTTCTRCIRPNPATSVELFRMDRSAQTIKAVMADAVSGCPAEPIPEEAGERGPASASVAPADAGVDEGRGARAITRAAAREREAGGSTDGEMVGGEAGGNGEGGEEGVGEVVVGSKSEGDEDAGDCLEEILVQPYEVELRNLNPFDFNDLSNTEEDYQRERELQCMEYMAERTRQLDLGLCSEDEDDMPPTPGRLSLLEDLQS